MFSKCPRFWQHLLGISLFVLLSLSPILAQNDPNFDSPTPVLLSQTDSTRALAATPENFGRADFSKMKNRAFAPNEKILLFVSNLTLMPNEKANAFRVAVVDAKGRSFRFPVVNIRPAKGQPNVYALTVKLTDELGFWEKPNFDGDVLINVTWRGLTTNRLRLGIGKTGGDLKNTVGEKTEGYGSGTKGYSGDRVRFLEQAAFGPTSALVAVLNRTRQTTWIDQQFMTPYPTNPYPDLPLRSTIISDECRATLNCVRDYYSMYLVQNWFFKEAFYGDAQLKHRVAWALSQLWVISGVDTQQASWMVAYHQKLAQHTFGNYRDLMTDITLNPGMGNFLDMARSTRNNPNENFAREILQLFNVGLFMLNQDGTLQLDGNGNPIPTYDQTTVNNFTKVFTGWTFCSTGCPNSATGIPNYKDPLVILNPNNHDITAKTLLSYPGAVYENLPAGQNGATDLTQALDNIFYHPNVAPFVSRHLIQQMVTSDPSPAYIGRVAAAFNNNGAGVRGDMKAVIKAVLLDVEARGDVKTDPNYGKLREPVQFATNISRQFGVRSFDGTTQSDGYLNGQTTALGQNVFNSPTVFNYYQPGYTIPGTALKGPEFNLLTTGSTIARANFVNTMIFTRITVGNNSPLGTSLDFAEMQALAASDPTGNQLVDTLNGKMMHGTMSPEMKSTILTAVQAVAGTDTLLRAQTAIYLIATSSQYQIQR